jgi:hypothetical protein
MFCAACDETTTKKAATLLLSPSQQQRSQTPTTMSGRTFLNMIQEMFPLRVDEIQRYERDIIIARGGSEVQYTIEGLLSCGVKINAYKSLIARRKGWGNNLLSIKTEATGLMALINAWIEYYTEKMRSYGDSQLFPV